MCLAATPDEGLAAFPPGESPAGFTPGMGPQVAHRSSRRWSRWHQAQLCSRQRRLPVLLSRAADAQQLFRAADAQQLPSSHSSSACAEVHWRCGFAPGNAGPQATQAGSAGLLPPDAAVRQRPRTLARGWIFALGFCARRIGAIVASMNGKAQVFLRWWSSGLPFPHPEGLPGVVHRTNGARVMIQKGFCWVWR